MYKHKAIPVQICIWTGKNAAELQEFIGTSLVYERTKTKGMPNVFIQTYYGRERVVPKTVIIKDAFGRITVSSKEDFDIYYEKVK